jgi:hypothetical protein
MKNLVDDAYEENMAFFEEVISMEFSSKANEAAAQLDFILAGFENIFAGKPAKVHVN